MKKLGDITKYFSTFLTSAALFVNLNSSAQDTIRIPNGYQIFNEKGQKIKESVNYYSNFEKNEFFIIKTENSTDTVKKATITSEFEFDKNNNLNKVTRLKNYWGDSKNEHFSYEINDNGQAKNFQYLDY